MAPEPGEPGQAGGRRAGAQIPPAPSSLEGWVLDLDGTLTVPVHDFDAIRVELGLSPGEPILEQLALLPRAEAVPLHARLDSIEEELARGAVGAPGADMLLDSILGRGARVGILTRNTKANALLTLEAIGLGGLLDGQYVLGRGEVDPKPSPAGIHHLLDRWGLTPAQAVMVGDDRFDLDAGRHAGVWTAHVDPAGDHLWPQSTDFPVRSLLELLQVPGRSETAPHVAP